LKHKINVILKWDAVLLYIPAVLNVMCLLGTYGNRGRLCQRPYCKRWRNQTQSHMSQSQWSER